MRQYEHDPLNESDNDPNRQTKLPKEPMPRLTKYGEVKRGFDFLITTPGKLRRGVARHGDALRGFTDYNLKLFRGDDKRWALYLEWVDMDGEGHRVVLPHEVVAGVLQRANSIIAQCRRERAQRAALTRKHKREAS
jgi:hypothetical protein